MINVYSLCSNCPPPAATQARSLFRRSPTALSIMRCSSLSHSSAIRRRSSLTSVMLVLRCLSLSSVGIWRIILAQNQIINFVDFVSNTRSAWATATRVDRLSTVPVSSILRISFFKPLNDHCLSGNIDIKCLAPYCLVCRNNSIACLSSAENGIVINF